MLTPTYEPYEDAMESVRPTYLSQRQAQPKIQTLATRRANKPRFIRRRLDRLEGLRRTLLAQVGDAAIGIIAAREIEAA